MSSSLQVVCAIIYQREEVLIAERPQGKLLAGYWEFPGGKIEPGETPSSALKRELMEELELKIEIQKFQGTYAYDYDWGSVDLHVFAVKPLNEPTPTADIQVFKWINPAHIDPKLLAEANRLPLSQFLQSGP